MLATMVLAFGLNTIAHAAHEHADSSAHIVHATCAYCAAHAGLIDAPRHSIAGRIDDRVHVVRIREELHQLDAAVVTSAQPRGPPTH